MAGDVTSRSPVTPAVPGVRERGPAGGRLRAARLLSWAVLIGVAVTLVVFAALHVLPPTSHISPVSRTISEYALTSSAWAFNLGVVALCAASVAVFAGLAMLRRIPVLSAATLFGVLWVAGLLTLVSFPKHNWALGGSGQSGQIHRMASLVAFLALPIAVLLITRRRDRTAHPAAARWAFWLAILSFGWFSPIVIAVLTAPRTWWQQIPLGLVERGLALTEVLAVVALALLVRSDSGGTPSLRLAGSKPARRSGRVRLGSTRRSVTLRPRPRP